MFLGLRKLLALGIVMLWAMALAPNAFAQGTPTPGQNVNMVSGTKWPGGDPFLRQQNEPSIAVSTRNPQHLLAGANDYRTVDLNLVDQLPINQLSGDAWLGVFKSFDGGQRWQSTLLPGFPQDQSTFGASSPMKGFAAASDPTVRAGTNGMFYYTGIALNRNTNIGGLFLARFIDLNNKENGDAAQSNYPAPPTDPIRYINTVEIDAGTAGQFIDKPWTAVDIPRAGALTCTIQATQQTLDSNGNPVTTTVTQTFPGGNVYVAWAKFVGGVINVRSKINFAKSSDCGATWTKPIMLSQTYDINQGTQVAVDPETGYVYVAWRVFSGSGTDHDAIVVAKSTDGGNTFTKAVPVRTLTPYTGSAGPAMFDQNTSGTEFRDQTMPTLAVDDSGTAGVPGRVYVAWAERGVQQPQGDARILVSTSTDGVTWPAPAAVDNGALSDDFNNQFARGHQLMPAMTFIGGKLVIIYYDLRLDATTGVFSATNPFGPDAKGKFFEEDRPYVGDPLTAVFTPFVDDNGLHVRRHTMDVMVAQSSGGSNPIFTTARLSRYDFGLPDLGDVPGGLGVEQLEQLKVNPPNLPMFAGGTVPFMGDYVDVAGQMFVPLASGGWTFNNPVPTNVAAASAASKPASSSPIYFGSWTTNQDVIPPADGVSWTKYTAPAQGNSVFTNGQPLPACATGYEGDRNQNIYESRITQGLYVSSPQNSKPLGQALQRAFVILVQNSTNVQRGFQLSIANQPPGTLNITGQNSPGGFASFQQAVPNQPQLPNPLPSPVTTALATIPAQSGATRTVFALSNNFAATITVNVNEIQIDANGNPLLDGNGNGMPVQGGLSSFVVLNADGTVPTLIDPDGGPANTGIAGVEVYTPGITHPTITAPGITHPGIPTPGITHQNPSSPGITHPDLITPGITHPGVPNQSIPADAANASLADSGISATSGSGMLTDATYTVSNNGNTSAAYIVKLAGQLSGTSANVPLQVTVTQVYTTQTAVNCALTPLTQDITNVNVTTPGITHTSFSNPGITHPAPTDATILLAPGDSAFITVRGQTDTATMNNIVNQVTPVVVPQAVNTNSTSSTPTIGATPLSITTTSLPSGTTGTPYNSVVQAAGGAPPYAWSVIAGSLPFNTDVHGGQLTLDPATGTISGTPGCPAGVFCIFPATSTFTVQTTDSSPTPNSATQQLSITIVRPAQPGIIFDNFNPLAVTQAAAGPPTPTQPVLLLQTTEITGLATYHWNNATGAAPGTISLQKQGGALFGPYLTNGVPGQGNVPNAAWVATPNVILPAGTYTVVDSGPATWSYNTGVGSSGGQGFARVSGFAVQVATLTFLTQPSNTPQGRLISPPVQVVAKDSSGTTLPFIAVTLALGNAGGATLSGTLMQTTDATGTATFPDLRIDNPGTSYTLIASAPGVPGTASNAFFITPVFVITDATDCAGTAGCGSLRQAMLNANAQAGFPIESIVFNIGNGAQTITPLTALPTLNNPTIIDGTTQPGYAGTPIIELNGSSAGAGVSGLHITAGASRVSGFVIDQFSGDGILLDTNGADTIQANYIGTDVNGAVAHPNGGSGIHIVATANNVVGGTASSMRNVISGNGGEGIRIDGNLGTGNVVQGNFIGTNATGSVAVGNNASGVYIRRAPGNSVIGNVVSGNVGFAGITICGIDGGGGCGGGDVPGIVETSNAAGNTVEGNFIGTDASGVNPLGNNQAGVSIDGAPNTQVGQAVANNGNTISNNGTNDIQIFSPAATGNQIVGNTIQGKTNASTVGISEGIAASLAAGTGNTFSQNQISGHGGLGIDIAPIGVNPNTAGGANNYPVITSAQLDVAGTITINGTLNSVANATFTVEFFSNAACNASGHGEGAVFLGSLNNVVTDGSGNAGFKFAVASPAGASYVTGTATDANGSTSEFSACTAVTQPIL